MPPSVPLSSNAGLFTSLTTAQRVRSPLSYPATLGVGSVQVIGENLARLGILFANPGSFTVYVCPAQDASGNALNAGGAGSIPLAAGQWIILSSGCGTAWNASAASGTGNPFTVMEFIG